MHVVIDPESRSRLGREVFREQRDALIAEGYGALDTQAFSDAVTACTDEVNQLIAARFAGVSDTVANARLTERVSAEYEGRRRKPPSSGSA